jgi:glycosyltransferase involved in cell wall biosynthesis
VLIGDGPVRQHLAERIERESIRRVRLLPPQPRHRVPALLAGADVAVISLSTSIPGSVPSKIYEAMASALPILMIAEGEASRRVSDARCGICVRPGDLEGAVSAFRRLAAEAQLRAQLGQSGRIAAETQYNRNRIASQLDQFLKGLIVNAAKPPPHTTVGHSNA